MNSYITMYNNPLDNIVYVYVFLHLQLLTIMN